MEMRLLVYEGANDMVVYYVIAVAAGVLSSSAEVIERHFSASRTMRRTADRKSQGSRWNLFDYLAVTVLIAFSGLRFEVGTDYAIYALNYIQIEPASWLAYLDRSPLEAGYTLLTIGLRSISDSPHLIFWVTAALTVLPAYATIKKQSLDPTFALLLYVMLAFFVTPFNVIRQGVAVALNFWASTFLGSRTTFFVLINLLACTFHLSAAPAALIQMAAWKWRPNTRGVLVILAGAVMVVFVIGTGLVRNILAVVFPRYESYLDANAAGIGTYLMILVKFALVMFALHLVKQQVQTSYAAYASIGLLFLVVGTQFLVVSRMESYFGIFLVLLLPNCLALSSQDAKAKGLQRALVLVVAATFFAFYLRNYGSLVPYQTYL